MPVHHCRPSGDRLFESLPAAFGRSAVAIVLTGFGRDGAAGAQSVRRSGGIVIGDMPRAALQAGPVDHILPLGDIGPMVAELVAAGDPT